MKSRRKGKKQTISALLAAALVVRRLSSTSWVGLHAARPTTPPTYPSQEMKEMHP